VPILLDSPYCFQGLSLPPEKTHSTPRQFLDF
jgi:hypothetical protein